MSRDASARTPADQAVQAPASPRPLTDAQIVARIKRAKNGAKVAALWKGESSGYLSRSEADVALCVQLALLTGQDRVRVDRLFRQSGRYRPEEWDATHDGTPLTYGENTIARALGVLDERVRSIDCSIRSVAEPSPVVGIFARTDSGNAEYFAARWGHIVRFDHRRREWLIFTGHHWSPNRSGEVQRLVLDAIRARQAAAVALTEDTERKAELRWSIESENRTRRDHLMVCAAPIASLAVVGDCWDSHPLLLGVRNGVLDLESGRLRDGAPIDGITKVAPVVYDPRATCPRFERFMREVFASAPELVAYLQRCFGYALTGLTTEQVFWIFWGLGANGKSTVLEVFLHAVLGARDYAWTMPFPTAGWSNAMSEYQKALLVGRRFVSSSEVSAHAQLNEALIKSLTGDDTINARHPYCRPFQFAPVAKYFLRVNDKPLIRDQSHGMWRRLKLVPFTRRFPIDRQLGSALRAEAVGILAWSVRGCLEWQRERLCHPAIVDTATTEYRAESDPLVAFFRDRCILGETMRAGGRELFTAYGEWCDAQQTPSEERLTQTGFGLRMKEQFHDVGSARKVIYSGVGLRSASDAPADPAAGEQE